MKQVALVLLTAAILLAGVWSSSAREVVLEVGEVFRDNDLTIRCTDPALEPRLLMVTDCQYWDDFGQVCLYERMTYHYGNLQCVEECQHWDSFDGLCHFATQCELIPDQRVFLRTSCDIFDRVENNCRRTRQELLR
jgi:hypothetical protein